MPILTDTKDFIRNEFSKIHLGDVRLNNRLLKVAEAINEGPSLSIPSMTNAERSQLKGIYRFFQNPKVSEEKIMQNHYVNTVERMDSYHGKILLACDTCFVSPSKKMDGLLTRGKGKDNCVRTHYCLAMSADGKQLFGILDFNILSDPISKKHPDLRDESDIWIKTAENSINNIYSSSNRSKNLLSRCIFLADREGDEFELMKFLSENNLGFIIRSQYNRVVKFEGKEEKLLDIFKKSKKHGSAYDITTQIDKVSRKVKVERRILTNIEITPPVKHRGYFSPLTLNMVLVTEKNRIKPRVEWKLWTTEKISKAPSSEFIVNSYGHRWKIEEVNKAAKTGVRVEKRQFTSLDHYNPFLAMAFVVAWRMVALRTVTEISPDKMIQKAFEENEVLYLKAEGKRKGISIKVVKDALLLIAKLGGFTGSYSRPGWQVLWQGWMKFYERVEGFKLARKMYSK